MTEIQANQSILVTFRAVGDTTPPAVTISSPLLGSTYVTAQTVRLLADASDNVAVSRVDFYNGPTRVASVSAPPYFYDWALSPSKNGTHTWTAKAYDGEGNFTISQPVTLNVDIPDVDVTPPTVTVLTPISGATFSTSTITLSGTAEDAGSPSSGIVVVEVRVRGEWLPASGTLTWSREVGLVLGGNVFEVRSRDGAGTYSDPKIIVVSHDGPRTRVIIDSEPRSIPILVDGKPTATLGSMELIVGSFHTLEAPVLHTSQEGVQYEFVNWSNNRPRQHSFEAQQVDATYTAHYRPLQVAGSNLGEIAIRDGAFQFELRASPGSVHVIEVSPDLKSWSPISTSTVPASSSLFFTARLGSEEEHNFFRAAKYAPALFVDSFDRPNSSVVGGRWIQSSENGMASIRSNALRLSATADQQAHIQSDGETHTGVLISFVLAVVTANQNQVIQIGTKGGGSGDNPYRNCFGFAILPGRGLQPNDTGFEGAITPFTFAEGGRYHVEIRIFANASRELRVWSVNDPRPAIATVSAAAKTVLANGTKYQIGFDAGSPLHTDLSIDDFRIALIE